MLDDSGSSRGGRGRLEGDGGECGEGAEGGEDGSGSGGVCRGLWKRLGGW